VSAHEGAVGHEEVLVRTLEGLLPGWGPVVWRGAVASIAPAPDPPLARMLAALADIEDISFYMQVFIRRSGVARLAAVREFNAIWLAEESEHARALAALAAKYGAPNERRRQSHGRLYRALRALIVLPRIWLARLFPHVMLATYLTIGGLQEYVALTAYTALADRVAEPASAEVLRQIARQEARHMRFYRRGAEAVLAESAITRRVVRYLVESDWKPPGVSLLGAAAWADVFRPLLADRALVDRLLRMDRLVAALPGLSGLNVMERFLASIDD
jgi:uncharacterized protein YjeT (DUF2065 family)